MKTYKTKIKTVYPDDPIMDFNSWIRYIKKELTNLKYNKRE